MQHRGSSNLFRKMEAELKRLREEGTIEPVIFSEWAAPIVPVIKQNGTVRICGDYRLTVNQSVKRNSYPLLQIEDIFCRLFRRTKVHQIGPESGVPAGSLRRQIQGVCRDQYAVGII